MDEISVDEALKEPLTTFCLRLADFALVSGHRLSEWAGHAPILEEDLALANLGLDMIGQARALYTYAGVVEGEGRDEDQLAYLRRDTDYLSPLIVELPKGDFAFTMVRQYFVGSFLLLYFGELTHSRDQTLAGIAAKAEKEMAYHRRHCGEWVIRLGDGTSESHDRMEDALDTLWSYVGELFECDQIDRILIEAGIAVDASALKDQWLADVRSVFEEATLTVPDSEFSHTGGRSGKHTEHLSHMLGVMQTLQRSFPGADW
ncbi:MAG: 1,2-phenylacetyl-CoA epoxidase subunit PaaC [Pseudomonadota bacterium]